MRNDRQQRFSANTSWLSTVVVDAFYSPTVRPRIRVTTPSHQQSSNRARTCEERFKVGTAELAPEADTVIGVLLFRNAEVKQQRQRWWCREHKTFASKLDSARM